MIDNNRPEQFNILCLSGGGFRGLYTARVLADLEKNIGTSIANCFDLIAGTSIGGIIAIAVALEIPCSHLVKKFKKYGKDIFPSKYRFIRDRNIFKVKHSQNPLKNLVKEMFYDKRIQDIKHRIMIPSVNYTNGKPRIFKTSHHKDFREIYKVDLVDIALATSAAPWYFPIHKTKSDGCYVDGGLYGNAPDLLALHEAQYFLGKQIENINLLSIGTMSPKVARDTSKKTKMSFWDWKQDLFSLMVSSQEQITNFQLGHLLKKRYHRIDSVPSHEQVKHLKLDVATEYAVEVLESEGSNSAQCFLGDGELFDKFLGHRARQATFY